MTHGWGVNEATTIRLQALLARRWYSLKKRSAVLGVPVSSKVQFVADVTRILEVEGFVCRYCQQPIDLWTTSTMMVLSIDHKIALSDPARPEYPNGPDNLIVCHHRCNLAKGVMAYETFIEVMATLRSSPELLERYLNENYRAHLAHKLDRVEVER